MASISELVGPGPGLKKQVFSLQTVGLGRHGLCLLSSIFLGLLTCRALASLVRLDWEPLCDPNFPPEWKLPTDRNYLFLSPNFSGPAHLLHKAADTLLWLLL